MTKFAAQAPVLVVVLAVRDNLLHRLGGSLQGTPFYLIDIGIAGEHFVLKAEEQGLATCWVGWFDARRVRKVLHISGKYKIAALFPLGYAASRPAVRDEAEGPGRDRLVQRSAMRRSEMAVFLLVVLAVYGGANFYILRRGAQALAGLPASRAVFFVPHRDPHRRLSARPCLQRDLAGPALRRAHPCGDPSIWPCW